MVRIVVAVGSACDDREYVAVVVQLHRFVQSVLNAYGVECNHAPPISAGDVIANDPADHSGHELLANMYVGDVVSLRMINVFELVVHHISDILMITLVDVFAVGVNVNDRLFELSVHDDHPFVEYATAVLGHQLAVSFMLHVVLDA